MADMDECLIHQYPELESSHFWWVSRRELVVGLMDGFENGHRPAILDVGCGSGFLAKELAASGAAVTGVDVASHPEWSQRGSAVFHEGDYLDLAAEVGSFDIVVALDVMEHMSDEASFVARLFQNVRPGGHAIVTVPAYQWLWSGHDELNRHFRRYTSADITSVLSEGGLTVTRCGYIYFGLILPKIVAKGLGALRDDDGIYFPSPALNRAALIYFRREHRVATRRRDFLPAGTSVVAICRRP